MLMQGLQVHVHNCWEINLLEIVTFDMLGVGCLGRK